MDYIFCFLEESQGWWLKIDSIEKLGDYYEKTANRWAMVIDDYMRNYKSYRFDSKLTEGVVRLAESRNLNIMDGIIQMKLLIAEGQIERLHQEGCIFINAAGGYHAGSTYTQWVKRKELLFPQYTEKDIRIEKFKGGAHWYAYIGDMQLRNIDNFKWNTHDAALSFAKQYVKLAEQENKHEQLG